MTLKVYSHIVADEEGFKYYPSGDYSLIKEFGNWCNFSEGCVFGDNCIFGKGCSFGKKCKFEKRCSFGAYCNFADYCSFGSFCCFGERSSFDIKISFDNDCSFAKDCSFAEGCNFGEECSFGENCNFDSDCTFEDGYRAKTHLPFLALAGAGTEARTCYFFNFEAGIHVRAGCFFGALEEFKAAVREDEETPQTPSTKTKVYLAFCDLAELQFTQE